MTEAGHDFATQIRRIHRTLTGWGPDLATAKATGVSEVVQRYGLARRGQGQPEVIVSERVAAELGKPPASSHALVLTTQDPDLIEDGRVRWLGPELADLRPGDGPWGYAQLIMVQEGPQSADPIGLVTTGSLSARLPGVMSRASGDRLWLRFSHKLLDTGFGLAELGSVLVAAYRQDHPELRSVEVVLVGAAPDALASLAPVAAEVSVLSGQQRKLHLVGDGELVCDDLDCDNCDNQKVCDLLEDVRVRYRQRRTE